MYEALASGARELHTLTVLTTHAPTADLATPLEATRLQVGRAIGVALGIISVVSCLVSIALYVTASDGGAHELIAGNGATNLVLGASLGLLGAVLLHARPRNPLGWIVVGTGLANALSPLGDSYALHAFAPARPLPLGVFAAWVSSWVWVVGFVPAFTVLLARYPTGQPASRGWRLVDRLGWIATAAAGLGMALVRDAFDDVAPARYAPFGTGANDVGTVFVAVGLGGGLALGTVAAAGTLVRLYHATTPVREQLAWLVACITPVTVSAMLAPSAVTLALIPLVPLGLGLGILRYRILDIQVVLRRTLLYGLLTAIVLGVYAGVVAALTALVPRGPFPQLLAAAVIVVGLRPGYDLLRTGVERYVYGDRRDPVRAVGRLGRELASASDAEGPLPRAIHAVADALRVPYVMLTTSSGHIVEYGTPAGAAHHVDLHYAGRVVGQLAIPRRTPREPLNADDLALLDLLAGPLGITVHAAQLADDVAVARERLLDATEQERSRLRHDLHDGLGPSLTGIGLGLEAAELAAMHDPEALVPLLQRLRAEVTESLLDVRRLVDGLRPAALDAASLTDALRDHAAAVTARDNRGLVVDVAASASLPELPRQTEVVAYRIALEALTNVVRHANAQHCVVRVDSADAELRIEIADDGSGIAAVPRAGVGIDSMRARAAELGGTVEVRSQPGVGTTVCARLPLTASP
jgi:signal transduction histidine kinase